MANVLEAPVAESRRRTWQVGALLFGSGCCALIYQTAWMREFRLVFGASTAASAAVLAIFIGGLGLGSLLLGPKADRHSRPILFYSQLESIIALAAALTPFLLMVVARIYVALGGSERLGLVVGTGGRLVLSALVLAVPTVLMGGTLPAAARGVTRRGDVRRQDVAALYALNTVGAVVGCVAATFVLLELYGTRATLWLAAAINLLIAMIARQVDRAAGPDAAADPPAAPSGSAADAQAPLAFLLTASAVVGAVFFLMELVWYRMLGPLLGGSVFTFGLILGVALAGIGLGGLVYSLVGGDRQPTLGGFALSCMLEALCTAAAFALGDRLAVLALVLTPLGRTGFAAQVMGWSFVTLIAVFPTAVVSGYQFPLLIGLFGRGRTAVGRQIGLAYAANTAGAIVGSLAGGFGLIPSLSAPGAWRASAAALVVLGASAVVLTRRRGGRGVVLPAALGAVTIVLLAATGPTAFWRDGGIGAGRAKLATIASRNQLIAWMHSARASRVWSRDGVESNISLFVDMSGYGFYVNGKSDGSGRGDAGTQVMLGLAGAALVPNPRRSLVIGLGTGSTAGWLAAVPQMQRVDVVELEPIVLDIARACAPVNLNVMDNPKVHVTIGDAREWLLTSRDTYDLIASEPSNPYRAGVASLFTREYYEAAKERLDADGVFIQWVQAYEVDAPTIRTIYATLGSVFEHVETWQGAGSDLLLIAAKHPTVYRVPSLEVRIRQEPYRSALQVAWRSVDLAGFLAHFIAGDRVTRTILAVPFVDLNTDDRNVVEFGFARSVGRGTTIGLQVRDVARHLGADHPPIADGHVEWPLVDTAWIAYMAGEQQPVASIASDPPLERERQEALIGYFNNKNAAGVRDLWARQTRPPVGPNELLMMADALAQAGSDDALPYIEQLRALEPSEADLALAQLRFSQRRDSEAAAALASMLERLRVDPWALWSLKVVAVEMARALSTRSPETVPRLMEAVRQPFALRAVEADRVAVLATLAASSSVPRECAAVIGALEPDVPWSAGFLAVRQDCYAKTGDQRRAQAARDLADFAYAEGLPLSAGLAAVPTNR